MKKIYIILCISIAVFSIGKVQAQDVQKAKFSSWFTVLSRIQFSERWSFSNEIHERTNAFFHQQGQLLIRPSIDFHINKFIETSIGYTYLHVWPYDLYNIPFEVTENNLWEQFLFKFDLGKIQIHNRLREEQRWTDKVENSNGDYYKNGIQYGNRLRFRFGLSADLYQFKKSDKALFFAMFDEIWIKQDAYLRPNAFQRNWLYIGLGFRFTKNMNLQLGYMNQYDKTGTKSFVSTSILQFTFQHKIILQKKKKEKVK